MAGSLTHTGPVASWIHCNRSLQLGIFSEQALPVWGAFPLLGPCGVCLLPHCQLFSMAHLVGLGTELCWRGTWIMLSLHACELHWSELALQWERLALIQELSPMGLAPVS